MDRSFEDYQSDQFFKESLKRSFELMFNQYGKDLGFNKEEIENTPDRLSRMFYNEYFSGLKINDSDLFKKTFHTDSNDIVIQKDIPFCSVCAHHVVPFRGVAHVGYIPNGKLVGLSKLGRLVECFARRPQLQEHLTKQIADSLELFLNPQGCMVIVKAEHLCVTTRGVNKPGSETVTSALRGIFSTDQAVRQEFLELLKI